MTFKRKDSKMQFRGLMENIGRELLMRLMMFERMKVNVRFGITYEKPVYGFDDEVQMQIHRGNIPN